MALLQIESMEARLTGISFIAQDTRGQNALTQCPFLFET
jgi:hypothetical protein